MTNDVVDSDLANAPSKLLVADLLARLPEHLSLAAIADEVNHLARLREEHVASQKRNDIAQNVIAEEYQQDEPELSQALEMLRRMPSASTFEDILEEVTILIALREADEDVAAGRVIPNEEVKRILGL